MSIWRTGNKEAIALNDIIYILTKVSKSNNHKIIVGTDSVKSGYYFVFTKAICVLNEDFYDRRYFYFRDKIRDNSYLDLSKRLLKETTDSLDLAMEIKKVIDRANIEIHADVNPDSRYLSSKYKNMISGYITGCGFSVKVKPLSFVASSIADLHTRKK
jgi:uncharacterized protein